jgi:hypothetical protein
MENVMTLTGKLELRLKENPPYWKGNLPPGQAPGPEIPAVPRSVPAMPMSRGDTVEPATVGTPDDLPPQD